jgi:predicted DNA binding CopG/RHH family protein
MLYYKFRGVNLNLFVYYNEKNKNYVHQLKLTSGNRPSNDREYDKMYDVLKKLGNERRLGKLDDSDVDIYFEEADLTKPQIKKVHKMADELPKKDFKDRYGKEKGDAVRYATATNIVKKKLGIEENMKNEEMRLRVEAIAGLKKKAEKSGMPYSILKKVYDRGMAAWKGGHRPGASQHQWAFARVNSFVTKSSGTWGGADKDLAKQVRGSK